MKASIRHESLQRINPILIDCCIALLSDYNVEVVCDGPVARSEIPEEGIVAFIGFLGETIRGSLVISAPAWLIGQALPVGPGEDCVPEEAQRDWARELSNQLLGRLKLKLALYGVHFDLSTPSAMMGRELRGFKSGLSTHVLRFSTNDTSLYVEFNAQFSPDFLMCDTPLPDMVSVQEGEMLMLI